MQNMPKFNIPGATLSHGMDGLTSPCADLSMKQLLALLGWQGMAFQATADWNYLCVSEDSPST